MKKILLLMVVLVAAVGVAKQRSTRTKLRTEIVATEVTTTDCVAADTISGDIAADLISVSGYEKPLRSRHETMMLTNNDSTATVTSVCLDITYTDMQGRTLHRRTATTEVTLPPLSTRLIDLKSWDVNTLFYYHLNVPTRTSSQATPYRVKIIPMTAILTNWR